jgi:hypothetical protein
MRWLILPLLAAQELLVGCTSCSSERTDDAGADADIDEDTQSDADNETSEADVDDGDRLDDADIPDGAVPMKLVEITRDRIGLDCGPGCQQISFADEVWIQTYRVSEKHVTYENDNERQQTLFIINLETRVEQMLERCSYYLGDPENCSWAAVHNNTIAFSTRRWDSDYEWTLWRYHIGDVFRVPLTTRVMTNYSSPLMYIDLHENMTTWWDSAIPATGLYAMSLEVGDVIVLTSDHCPCYGAPQLWGHEVVYESTRGWHDIWVVNIDSLEERNLNDDRVEQWTPAFDGQWVVWSDGRNDPCPLPSWDLCNTDIYGMAMPDGEIEPLCDHPAVQTHPDVHLGLVAWEDFRNAEDPNDGNARDANIDIYLLDLETRREVQVTSLPGPERMPRIWGRRLFYVAEDLIGQQAIFMIDLDEAGLL